MRPYCPALVKSHISRGPALPFNTMLPSRAQSKRTTSLMSGFLVGSMIAPSILANLNVSVIKLTVNPYIFLGGALFSLLTVATVIIKAFGFLL